MPGADIYNEEGTGYVKLDDVVVPTLVNWKFRRTDLKYITTGRIGGERGQHKQLINWAKELEIQFENMTDELRVKIMGGDIVTPGSHYTIFEEIITAVAGVFPALSVIPVNPNSEMCWILNADGAIDAICKNVGIGVPTDKYEYTIVNATGVITTLAAYAGDYTVNYAPSVPAAGDSYMEDDTDIIGAMNIQILEHAHGLPHGTTGSSRRYFPNCTIITPFEEGASREESPGAFTVVFSVGGHMLKSGKLT